MFLVILTIILLFETHLTNICYDIKDKRYNNYFIILIKYGERTKVSYLYQRD